VNRNRIKILIHIAAISLFLSGLVISHAVINSVIINPNIKFVDFFGFSISRIFMLDFSIVFLGISFFIEFFMTFSPIRIN